LRAKLSLVVVLLAPLGLAACSADDTPPRPDLRQSVAASPAHKTLLAMIRQAGLVGTLQSPGPYTLFAPTDAAFAALPPGIERKLLAPENKAQLERVLRYHLIAGRLTSADLEGKISTPQTLEGARLQIDGMAAAIEVGDATMIQAEIEASNGVIHVIDAVLLPPSGRPPTRSSLSRNRHGRSPQPERAGRTAAGPSNGG
jgi:uncharacterized surface protein with fasciclin (FAS1) repeats